ncbi:aldo/keto reductase [Aquimarina sp. AD1]|uniref:aldo/keto reductase n=1 Tax=Aquimarina sp. (strain AD1) TaxID=1714848 RepID=UPI000E472C60|nr:aldo/keto reductase [Aquimarina sp. AD1]AXT57598.1 aldo/keto reductase [Aquimarina sp. AD1]RKN35151.1 aldo/keto reductase [Aquimarina sp. AD1]
MKYRRLGNSDVEISEISFGCMSLEEDFEKTKELIHLAFDKGINYFDTADLYQNGNNEEMLGKAVKSFRDKIIIGTKVGNQPRENGEGWDWNPSKKYIINSVEKSLTRLKTDYIDLYQLHGGTIDDPIEETIDAFETLKAEGKIRYYGISSIRPNVIREYIKHSRISSVMMQYSLLDRRPEESCLQLLQKNNIAVLSRGSIAKGLLAGKKAKEYLEYNSSDVDIVIKKLKQLSNEDRTIGQIAIQFVLNHKSITSSVVGFRTEHQLQECIKALEIQQLSDEELNYLQNIIQPLLYKNHR